MKTDRDIQFDVEAELKWDPQIDETGIAVKVNAGIVTLTGYVHSFFHKYEAEQVAKRVAGVTAVANDILVRVSTDTRITDPDIARDAVAALQSYLPTSWANIKPVVREGHVMLEGSVPWHYQRERAETAIRGLKGVSSVGNSIRVVPLVAAVDVKQKIEEAFRRSAEIDAGHIAVDANGTEVTLRGEVSSWTEREQAQRSAWAAPGVTNVTNNLRVRP